MKIGLCTSLDNLELTEKLGYDYIEIAVSSIALLSDEEFNRALAAVQKSSIPVERVNVLFPQNITLIGPNSTNPKERDEYLERAFARVKTLGAAVAVFGSGAARRFPEGYPYREGYRELVKVTRRIGEIAGNHGITIAIEPLNLTETNCINSLKEGAMLEADTDNKNVGLLADLYHMLFDNEPMDNIIMVKHLVHAHIALREGRAFPVVAAREVGAFFEALKKIGYSGALSVEGRTDSLEHDAASALKTLRTLAANAQ
ncbi:tagatose 3-epimerase [Spirochaetia bacterium]|nr:tagatose 3-epimerase [Spirochaetia bacterium]